MNKLFIFFLLISVALFACKNKQVNSDANVENYVVEEQQNDENETDFFYSFKGEPTFEDFLSFFNDSEIPYSYSAQYYGEMPKILPAEFKSFVNFEDEIDNFILPVAKFSLYDKYVAVFFETTDLEEIYSSFFYIFDKNGKIIDSREIYYLSFMGEEHSVFKIDEFYNIFEIDMFFARGEGWNYQGDGIAYYMRWHEDYVPTEMERHKILSSGKISDDIPVLKTVENFLSYLHNGEFQKAYDLQKNSSWGSLENFLSAKAFGGIHAVFVDSLNILNETENSAEIFCSATYKDYINGSSEIQQKFILSKTNGKWLIVGMKVLEFRRIEYYYSEDFEFASLELSNITDKDFEFTLLAISKEPNDNYDEKHAGEIYGTAVFETTDHAVFVEEDARMDFYFTGISKVKIEEKNCSEYRNEDVSFNGIFEVPKY
ncbi:MAG: hypothetical protein JXL97_11090 [Bacteroidales bacterium]|nr:hypothetical protein [Bacteroidales bacterium]